MLLNNLDQICYAMQMKNLDILTHVQIKRQVDPDKFVEAQKPEIEVLIQMGTFEIMKQQNVPPKTRYLDQLWT
jgi:hypothetical protein